MGAEHLSGRLLDSSSGSRLSCEGRAASARSVRPRTAATEPPSAAESRVAAVLSTCRHPSLIALLSRVCHKHISTVAPVPDPL